MTRRGFLAASAAAGSLTALPGRGEDEAPADGGGGEGPAGAPLRLGLMTYMLGAKWDLDTVINNLTEARWEHAQLRTTHAHGVEVALDAEQRRQVRRRFEEAGIALSLASAFSYHSTDPAELRRNIEGTKEYVLLARDIGATGFRVFPNAILVDQGVPEEKTLAQIGKAVAECATFAADHGVEVRLANHGRGTNRLPRIRKILDHADCPHVWVNWNCDKTDVEDPGFEANFRSVADRIRNVHMHDLSNEAYPYRRLFELLRSSGYAGFCDAEVPESAEPLRFMRYYRALFLALQGEI
jgi:sugar phosphate isomerase/epimerase